MKLIIDATDQILGRLASKAAKAALKGDDVHIINSEKSIISGDPDYTIKEYKERRDRGDPYHGPFFPKHPDQIVKRSIRGMIPYRKPTGKAALKRVRTYVSVPEEFKDKKVIRFKEAENKLHHNQMTLGDLAVKLGVKKTW